jgi:diacylglycerol kinase (ATP)
VSVLIIHNPTAGYHQPAWREPVTRILSALGPVEFIVPESAEATTAAASEAEARGVPLIVAAGGDGTVHRVVNGLHSKTSHLGILPVGTGNDLAGYLGVPASPEGAAQDMLGGGFRDIDVIRFNGRRVFTSGIFCAIAESACLANRMKARWPWIGSLAYRLGAIRVIATRGGNPVAGVFVANMPQLGGNLRLPSGSVVDDGLCEVATLGGGRIRLTRTLLALSLGRPLKHGELTWERIRHTTLEFPADVMAYGDGEDLGTGRVFQVLVEPAAVRVRVAGVTANAFAGVERRQPTRSLRPSTTMPRAAIGCTVSVMPASASITGHGGVHTNDMAISAPARLSIWSTTQNTGPIHPRPA